MAVTGRRRLEGGSDDLGSALAAFGKRNLLVGERSPKVFGSTIAGSGFIVKSPESRHDF